MCYLETEVDCMKGELTETETAGDEALSEWEEQQQSRADELRSRSLLGRYVHREGAVAGLRKRMQLMDCSTQLGSFLVSGATMHSHRSIVQWVDRIVESCWSLMNMCLLVERDQ